jgi:UDP-N-acetylglucosamine acyltransferase
MFNINQIVETIPHRYPFLLVDRIIEFEANKRIVGIKNVTINEPFFTGHFPDHPIMPGVLILEALAQTAGVLMGKIDGMKGKIAYFGGIDGAKFRRPVTPGDQLRLELEVIKIRGIVGKFKGKAFVDGKLTTEGTLTFMLADKNRSSQIDKTASIHPSAEIGKDVKIGPHVIIGEEVKIGNGTIIDANAVIEKWTNIGEECHIHYGAIIGNTTQDKKYLGEKSFVTIGDRNDIREFVTINRATGKNNETTIGNDNLFLTNVHIAHDCKLGNDIVISNATALAGHVEVDDKAIIGGMAGITQFCRIGKLAMIGSNSKINQDIPPFTLVEGNPGFVRSLNLVGLSRNNVDNGNMANLKKAYRLLFRSNMNCSQAITEMQKLSPQSDELKIFINFLSQETKNGIAKRLNKSNDNDDSDK